MNTARFNYRRRPAREVRIGSLSMGGRNPVRVQSMTNTPTSDVEASADQSERIIRAGGELVRLTTQGVREAEAIGRVRDVLRAHGYDTPLVADVHFNRNAAWTAAANCEKVRINPGNFVDPGRTFRRIEYTDSEYRAELERIEQALVPFLELCREHSTAIRIGVNHGSLSDRIMSRYGDTPAGMTESAMEFLRVCRRHDFNNVVISIKASNVQVMVETVRRLVSAMDAEDMHYPLHLGVTEAGDGEDGRIKSAVGIGALLAQGIGDTIRVSLSEAPEAELPVARMITDYVGRMAEAPSTDGDYAPDFNPVLPGRRQSEAAMPLVVCASASAEYLPDAMPDRFLDTDSDIVELDVAEIDSIRPGQTVVLSADHQNQAAALRAALHKLMARGVTNAIIPRLRYSDTDADKVKIMSAVDAGSILLDGFTDGLMIEAPALTPAEEARVAFAILQSARLRMTRTEYISCPGCGRTLFDLQSTLAAVKGATSHLKGLKIGVMGCIVNGPGEMADADYGYVGAAAGKISLYKGKECIEKNIPAEEAIAHLVKLIKDNGDWVDPE